MNKQKLNETLTLALKGISILVLASSLYAGGSIYNSTVHKGPSCKKSNFSYWLKKDNVKGNIVSIHENKIQLVNGTTSCFGTFEAKNGSYKKWNGEMTKLDDGSVVGSAVVF